jgi:hypothetical protein
VAEQKWEEFGRFQDGEFLVVARWTTSAPAKMAAEIWQGKELIKHSEWYMNYDPRWGIDVSDQAELDRRVDGLLGQAREGKGASEDG